jgi:hypothetical protein
MEVYGGEGGIRTPDTRKGMPDFESGAFNRALPPLRIRQPLIANGFCGIMSGRSIIPKVTSPLLQEATFRSTLHPKSRRIPINPMLKLSPPMPGHDFPVLWDSDTLTSEICTCCPCHLTLSVIRMEKSP